MLSETGKEGGIPKPVNQDTFLVDSTTSGLTVVGVFDGHGEQPLAISMPCSSPAATVAKCDGNGCWMCKELPFCP